LCTGVVVDCQVLDWLGKEYSDRMTEVELVGECEDAQVEDVQVAASETVAENGKAAQGSVALVEPQQEEEEKLEKIPGILSIPDRIKRCEKEKKLGNERFKRGDNKTAKRYYYRAIDVLDPLEEMNPPSVEENEKKTFFELNLSCNLNKAMAELRLKQYDEALESLSEAKRMIREGAQFKGKNTEVTCTFDSKTKVKIAYRRGLAYAGKGMADYAKDEFKEVLKLDPKNKDALREYSKLKPALKRIQKEQQKTFKFAFDKAGESGGMYADAAAEAEKRAAERKAEAAKIEADKRRAWQHDDAYDCTFEEYCRLKDEEMKERSQQYKQMNAQGQQAQMYQRYVAKSGSKISFDDWLEREQKLTSVKPSDAKEEVDGFDEDDLSIINETKRNFVKVDVPPSILVEQVPEKLVEVCTEEVFTPPPAMNAWQEREITEPAKKKLEDAVRKFRIEESAGEVDVELWVDTVTVTGDAQMVSKKGKTAPVFDFKVHCLFKAKYNDPAEDREEARKKKEEQSKKDDLKREHGPGLVDLNLADLNHPFAQQQGLKKNTDDEEKKPEAHGFVEISDISTGVDLSELGRTKRCIIKFPNHQDMLEPMVEKLEQMVYDAVVQQVRAFDNL